MVSAGGWVGNFNWDWGGLRSTLEIPNYESLFQVEKYDFLDLRTIESVVKLWNAPGKIRKITEKAVTGEILQGFGCGPPIFDCFGQLCQAKNFFVFERWPP